MKWHEIGKFIVGNSWQYSEQVKGQDFKIVYLSSPLQGRNSTAIIALASLDSFNDESLEFFKPQRINSYLSAEIIRFPIPPKQWSYRLALKKLALPNQEIPDFTIQIFMPVVDLNPDQPVVNPTIATVKNPISVSVGPAANTAVKLLPVNSANARKHATFYNPSTTRNLYIDTDSTVNTASAVGKVGPGKIYISDFPNWQGEYWGLLDGTGATAVSVAVEEYL